MRCVNSVLGFLVFTFVPWQALTAQPDQADIERVRGELERFSDLLEAGLGLDKPGGLFGMNIGSIQSRYLFGQGASLEIRSPLANSRRRLSLATLGTTMRELQSSQNPFARLSRGTQADSPRIASAAPLALAEDDPMLEAMTRQLQSIDYELIVGAALRQAEETAESLRSLDGIDDSGYLALRSELADLHRALDTNLTALADSMSDGAIEQALEGRLALLRDTAAQRAAELKDDLAQAQRDYEERWYVQRALLEAQAFEAACAAADTLNSFADDQGISLVFVGLGDEGEQLRPDRILVLPIDALRRCASGDWQTLQAASVAYSF